jgi:hypothetical protein
VELDAGLRRFLASCQGRYYAWYDDGYDDEESLFLPVLWGDGMIVFEDIIDATKCKLLFT